eukprot:6206531-Pleurochrysis_carterae.AAC.3
MTARNPLPARAACEAARRPRSAAASYSNVFCRRAESCVDGSFTAKDDALCAAKLQAPRALAPRPLRGATHRALSSQCVCRQLPSVRYQPRVLLSATTQLSGALSRGCAARVRAAQLSVQVGGERYDHRVDEAGGAERVCPSPTRLFPFPPTQLRLC